MVKTLKEIMGELDSITEAKHDSSLIQHILSETVDRMDEWLEDGDFLETAEYDYEVGEKDARATFEYISKKISKIK